MTRLISLFLIVLSPALLLFIDDPASAIGAGEGLAVKLGFGSILLGLVIIAAYLNSQTREDPFRLMTSWLAGAVAVLLVVAHHDELLTFGQDKNSQLLAPVQTTHSAGAAKPKLAASSSAFEIQASVNGNFYTQTEINGESVDMIVDTGATYVTLRFEDAEALGLDPGELNFEIALRTANGQSMGAGIRLDEVSVGGIVVEGVQAIVVEDGALGISLLGMSYLSKIRGFQVTGNIFELEE